MISAAHKKMPTNLIDASFARATLARLCCQPSHDASVDDTVRSIARNYVLSGGRELVSLVQLPLTAAASTESPLRVLTSFLLALENWKSTQPVLLVATAALKSLLRLFAEFDDERRLCPAIFPALQACISSLGDRLKAPAVDGIVSACFTCIKYKDWEHRAGALETLTILVSAVQQKHGSRTHLPLGDILDLISITVQRHQCYDASKQVKIAATKLLSAIDAAATGISVINQPQHEGDQHEKEEEADDPPSRCSEPILEMMDDENFSFTDESRFTQSSSAMNPLLRLALTPLPDFTNDNKCNHRNEEEKQEKRQNNWSSQSIIGSARSGAAQQLDACESTVQSKRNSRHIEHDQRHDDDVFSSLGSDLDSFNSAVEIEVQDFLRGSMLLPKEWENSSNKKNSSSSTNIHIEVLQKAVEQHFGSSSSNSAVVPQKIEVDDIELILRRCLDLHSEAAYEKHVVRAEEALVRSSREQLLTEAELLRQTKTLERDVHRAVANEQAVFLAESLPLLADILAQQNPIMMMQQILH